MKRFLAAFLLCAGIAGAQIISVGVAPSNGVKIGNANPFAGCGPPLYPCASTVAASPGNISYLFTSTAPTATTCAGMCQNSVAEDTTIPGHIAGTEKITRITDGSTLPSGRSVGNFTLSGGDNDYGWSYPNGSYLWIVQSGSGIQPYQITKTVIAGSAVAQVVNAGCVPFTLLPGNAFHTSWLDDTKFYYFINGTNSLAIQQGQLTGSGCSLSSTHSQVVDLFAAGVCPGVTAFTPSWMSIFGLSDDDDTFTISSGTGAQGSGVWLLHWSRTKGCATENMQTGQWWAFCASSCTPSTPAGGTFGTGATNCWGADPSGGNGIHDQQSSGDGLWSVPSRGAWTQGGCAGFPSTGAGVTVHVGIGNGINIWCSDVLICGGHNSVGISKALYQTGTNDSIRAIGTPSVYAPFNDLTTLYGVQQLHESWPHHCSGSFDDTCQWIGASGELLATDPACTGGVGASPVYCPGYLKNVVLIQFPLFPSLVKVIAHDGICGKAGGTFAQCTDGISDPFGAESPIGLASPDGTMFAWVSTMWHQNGLDNGGAPRADAYLAMVQ